MGRLGLRSRAEHSTHGSALSDAAGGPGRPAMGSDGSVHPSGPFSPRSPAGPAARPAAAPTACIPGIAARLACRRWYASAFCRATISYCRHAWGATREAGLWGQSRNGGVARGVDVAGR